MQKPIVNPLSPETVITLKDGVPRIFRVNYNALMILEATKARELAADKDSALLPLANLRRKFFAGLYEDAIARGESWTLDKCGMLMPAAASDIQHFMEQIAEVERLSQIPAGEPMAAADAAVKTKSRQRPGK